MSSEESAKIVRAAYDYLIKVLLASGTPVEKLSNFRVEEFSLSSQSKSKSIYKVTLSYEVVGEFAFDKKREYKDFEVDNEGAVTSMKIRNIK